MSAVRRAIIKSETKEATKLLGTFLERPRWVNLETVSIGALVDRLLATERLLQTVTGLLLTYLEEEFEE